MRLHRLRLVAFGPFAAEQVVDFDELSAAGLFLLHGQTGAGKTSVLDAVCFALYGSVPGDRPVAHTRSDHAAVGVAPEVELEVTLRGRRLRVTRSPAWQRPKLRGEGFTTEQARTLVRERVAGEWITRSTRNDEAAQLIAALTGLNAVQFCQVVLLPQGRFATFLRAKAEERAALLEQLFATRRFADVADWLAQRRREGRHEFDAARRASEAVLDRIAEAADTADRPEVDAASDWLAGLRASAAERHQHAADRARQARTERDQRRAAHAEMAALAERQREHERAAADALRLAAGEDDRDRLRAELAAARRASTLTASLAAVERAEAELASALTRRQRAAEALTRRGGPALAEAAEPQAAIERARSVGASARQEVGRLADLVDVATSHGELAAKLEKVAAERDDLLRERDQISATLANWPERARAAESRLRQAADAAARVEPLAVRLAAAQQRRDAAMRRDELGAAEAEAERAAADAAGQALAAKERWLDVRQARLDGMAAELAATLRAGEACPVCGSAAHPDPAVATAGQVTVEDERAAQRASEAAEAERARRESALAGLRSEAAAAQAVAGDEDQRTLAAGAEELAAEHAQAVADAADQHEAELARAALERAQQEATAALAATDQRVAALSATAAELTERVAEADRTLAAACGEDRDIASRLARLTALAEAADALVDTLAAHGHAVAALADRHAAAAEGLAAADFPDLDAARAAARPEARLAAIEAELAEHEREAAAVAARLKDPVLLAAAGQPAADVAAAGQRLAEADGALEQAGAELATAAETVRALQRLAGQLDAARLAELPLRERHELVTGLADLAGGIGTQNALRMSLSSFVLAARLEQVATAASERLARMTSGRYTIAHSDAVAGRGRSGLGLLVRDAWTGVDRDPATLSGGESFVTSLALALGLADVVAAEAGGAELETLFIDEGFGSLDADALEEVMAALDGLRDRGRVVGVVSHVAELRDRIPTRLWAHKGRAGSTLRQGREI